MPGRSNSAHRFRHSALTDCSITRRGWGPHADVARPTDFPDYGSRQLQIDPPCTGLDVWHLQIKLLAWGSGTDNDDVGNVMQPVIVNGKFDAATRDAVMRFQKAHKLKITGIVDGETFRHIDTESALHPVFVHTLKCPCVKGDNDGPILCRCTKH